MSYNIIRSNGSALVSVEDGMLDNTSTPINLIGKNKIGYGLYQNQNFVHLLENFANSFQPVNSMEGQLWYNSSEKKINYYDGQSYRTISRLEPKTQQPGSAAVGDLWFDISNNVLHIWNGSSYISVGGEDGTSQRLDALQAAIDALNVVKAPVANPVFTGVPLSQTAPPGTNNAQIATTQFVKNEIIHQFEINSNKSMYGYMTFPNGIILQWQVVSVKLGTGETFLFPLQYPNACFGAIGSKGFLISTFDEATVGVQSLNNAQVRVTNSTNLAYLAQEDLVQDPAGQVQGIWVFSIGY